MGDASGGVSTEDSGGWDGLHSHAPGHDLQWLAIPQCHCRSWGWVSHIRTLQTLWTHCC